MQQTSNWNQLNNLNAIKVELEKQIIDKNKSLRFPLTEGKSMNDDSSDFIVIPFTGRIGAKKIENNFQCLFCSFKVSSKSHMRMHIIQHSGIKPHYCYVCSYTSYEENRMKKHYAKVHHMVFNDSKS